MIYNDSVTGVSIHVNIPEVTPAMIEVAEASTGKRLTLEVVPILPSLERTGGTTIMKTSADILSNFTPATRRAVAKYGINLCLRAYKHQQAGNGARTIAIEIGFVNTNAANAAINAGRELANACTPTQESDLATL